MGTRTGYHVDMDNAMNTTQPHPFAMFGPGPYRVVGYREMVHQPVPEAPRRAGGTCDVCATCIMHAYTVRCADGREFVTGSECVLKRCPEYAAQMRAMRSAARAEARAYARSQEAQLRRAREEGTRLGWTYAIAHEDPEWYRQARELAALADLSDFGQRLARDVIDGVRKGLSASERTIEMVANVYREATLPESRHVGEIKKRIEMDLTWLRSHWFEGYYGMQGIHILAGPGGELVVWKSGNGTPHEKQGDTLRCRFTVKAHGERDGVLQTEVTRLAAK